MIEPGDRRSLTAEEAMKDPTLWSLLMRGGGRDLQLVRRLRRWPTLKTLLHEASVKARVGVVFGDRSKEAPHYEGMRLFDENEFPEHDILVLDTDALPMAEHMRVHSRDSTDVGAFTWPQLIVKRSWLRSTGRFHARLSRSKYEGSVLCNQSYISVHATASVLEAANLSHNSKIAVYFYFLTSGRFAAYRPKLSKDEILGLPIPFPSSGQLDGIESYAQLDSLAFDLFGLRDAERVLVEDGIEYSLGDFLNGAESKGSQRTNIGDGRDDHLRSYCEYFFRVMKAGFGSDKAVLAKIFRSPEEPVPYRLVAFVFGEKPDRSIEVQDITSAALLKELERLNAVAGKRQAGISSGGVVRIYEVRDGAPTVFIVKPDQKRFWTRSIGLQDGDDVALDLFRYQEQLGQEQDGTLH